MTCGHLRLVPKIISMFKMPKITSDFKKFVVWYPESLDLDIVLIVINFKPFPYVLGEVRIDAVWYKGGLYSLMIF